MLKKAYSSQEKCEIVNEIETGQIGVKAAVTKYDVTKTTLAKWRRRYKVYGFAGLEKRSHNRAYSVELKLQAVKDCLDGGLSQYEVIDKYKIASRSQLSNWIKKYNSHSSLKAYNGGKKAMTKGRSSTWQERIDIVLYCMARQHDYQKTADHYKVSYQQVYQWVKKYEDGGQDALKDGRGRKKEGDELTEADRQKLERKKLEYENERLRERKMRS
jgi:transposase